MLSLLQRIDQERQGWETVEDKRKEELKRKQVEEKERKEMLTREEIQKEESRKKQAEEEALRQYVQQKIKMEKEREKVCDIIGPLIPAKGLMQNRPVKNAIFIDILNTLLLLF